MLQDEGRLLSLILLGCFLLFFLMDYLCFTHRFKLSLLNFSFIPQINFLTIAPFGPQMSNEHIHGAWSNQFVICTFEKMCENVTSVIVIADILSSLSLVVVRNSQCSFASTFNFKWHFVIDLVVTLQNWLILYVINNYMYNESMSFSLAAVICAIMPKPMHGTNKNLQERTFSGFMPFPSINYAPTHL